MKTDDVKRSFRANRHERSIGDAPSLGRISRIAGTGMPQVPVRRRSSRGGRPAQKNTAKVLSWSIVVAVVALGGIGAAIFMWLKMRMGEVLTTQQSRLNIPEMVVRVPSKFPSPPEAEALGQVNRALAIRDPEMVAAYFRTGAASPDTVIGFLQGLDSLDGKLADSRWLGSMDANGLSLDGVLVSFKKEDTTRQRAVLLTPDAAGFWKIDFEAFARVVEPSWQELLENGASEAKVRVHLARDTYYNGPFNDDKEWVCYGMGSPDIDGVLTGYCRSGSPQAEALRWMFSKGEKLNRAMLQIRRVEGASARQFEITRVLAEDWVLGDKPFDEGFD